jgi:SAM-dependent methyltransferase
MDPTMKRSLSSGTAGSYGIGLDATLRYGPVLRFLKHQSRVEGRLLEIGSAGLGIAAFTNRQPIFGVDLHAYSQARRPPNLIAIQASAGALPFAMGTFACVVCVDTLEHVPPSLRQQVIQEALRVTAGTLLLTLPTGRTAAQVERVCYAILAPWYRLFHKDLSYLHEHLDYGLPTQEFLIEGIQQAWPDADIQVHHTTHLGLWILSLLIDPPLRWLTRRFGHRWQNFGQSLGQNWGLNLLYRLPFLHAKPTYRTLLCISKPGSWTTADDNDR